jgi:D-glycero-D-manno-heptose 1,7-bisphosphate phosphatase
MTKNWIFLDRDGTIIVEKNYLHDPNKVEILPGVVKGLLRLQNAGFKFVVCTNQSGIGRGYYGLREMDAVHKRIVKLLSADGIKIEAFFCCPHRPDENCECRKPKTGLAIQAAKELGFSLGEVLCVIGDKKCDVNFADNLKIPSVLVMTGYGAGEFAKGVRGLYNVDDMYEAAEKLIKVDGAP